MEGYYAKLSANNFSSLPVDEPGNSLKRPLEVIEFLSGEDGEQYAAHIVQILLTVEGENSGSHHVVESAVEEILTHIRRSRYHIS